MIAQGVAYPPRGAGKGQPLSGLTVVMYRALAGLKVYRGGGSGLVWRAPVGGKRIVTPHFCNDEVLFLWDASHFGQILTFLYRPFPACLHTARVYPSLGRNSQPPLAMSKGYG